MSAGNTARFLRTAVTLGLGVGAVVMSLAWAAGGAGLGWALLGWGSAAADVALRSITGTPDPKTGYGTWNWGKYSNPKLDQLIEKSLTTVSSEKDREANARAAAKFALDDHAIIPSHSQLAMWAMRRGLRYEARTDEWSLAQFFHKE